MRTVAGVAVLAVCAATPSVVCAQRIPFERTMTIAEPGTLDVTTDNGKIEVVPGTPGRIVVEGAATVRVGWNVPANAVEIAKRVAAAPPIEQAGATIRLRVPAEADAQRAVTVSYRVQVPPNTQVQAHSSSGATSIRGIAAAVDVRTQSAAIDLADLSGIVHASTGSGAVVANTISGPLAVTTESSGFTASRLGSSLRVRTNSGGIEAALQGSGDVDVETGSSAIRLQGVGGGLIAKTQSGAVNVQGAPGGPWHTTTSSGSVHLNLDTGATFELNAASRSGSVKVEGAAVSGTVVEHAVLGTVGKGGPAVFVRTGSGAITVQVGSR